MKHRSLALAGFWALVVAAVPACVQAMSDAGKPSPAVYALIAAIGEEFGVVSEVSSTGTHLSTYRRSTERIPDNLLNRFALDGLDAAIVKLDPAGKRVYGTFSPPPMESVAPSERAGVAIAKIVTALEKLPQRTEWDRIVIAVPAYQAMATDRMASKLQGFGIFSEPVCQAGCPGKESTDLRYLDNEPPDGVEAVNTKNEVIRARTFLAPFSYIEIWVLDAKTLAVIDRQKGFDHQKLAERKYDPQLDMDLPDTNRYLAGRIATLISLSVGSAVERSALDPRRPQVDIKIREITPDESKK